MRQHDLYRWEEEASSGCGRRWRALQHGRQLVTELFAHGEQGADCATRFRWHHYEECRGGHCWACDGFRENARVQRRDARRALGCNDGRTCGIRCGRSHSDSRGGGVAVRRARNRGSRCCSARCGSSLVQLALRRQGGDGCIRPCRCRLACIARWGLGVFRPLAVVDAEATCTVAVGCASAITDKSRHRGRGSRSGEADGADVFGFGGRAHRHLSHVGHSPCGCVARPGAG
mmetsp:Transcript_61687/g.177571  ORF Transcript_61687/g.177571 Transcript_61687/m.177571 type:complete len:231 (-) Transcript_61687:8-700(-)